MQRSSKKHLSFDPSSTAVVKGSSKKEPVKLSKQPIGFLDGQLYSDDDEILDLANDEEDYFLDPDFIGDVMNFGKDAAITRYWQKRGGIWKK